MSSNESTSKLTPQLLPNVQQDITQEQKQGTKTERKSIKSKSNKKKKQNSDSTSSDNISKGKMQELEFLGGNNVNANNQYNQNYVGAQQNEKQINEFQMNQYNSENPFQNFLEWSNQQNSQVVPPKQQQQILQQQQNNPYYLNQNTLFYEKDTLNSQDFNDNIKQEINSTYPNKQNNTFSNTQQCSSSLIENSQQQQQFSTILQKKQSTQKQQDGQFKLSQNEIEQQQQQQLFFENDFQIHKKQLICNQQLNESSIFNPNLNLETFQYDTNFSFNPNKIQYSNSFNPLLQAKSLNFQNILPILKNENSQSDKDICPFNQLQKEIVSQAYALPPILFSQEEPRYVNAAQFKRMMIMRIKRAARNLKQKEIVPQNEDNESLETAAQKLKRYKYESRHKHATNRIRDSKGRFIPTYYLNNYFKIKEHKLKQYLEDLEREKQEKEMQNEEDQENIDNNNKKIEKNNEIQKSNNNHNNTSQTQNKKQNDKNKISKDKRKANTEQSFIYNDQYNVNQEYDVNFNDKIQDSIDETEEERKEIYSSQQSENKNNFKQSVYKTSTYQNQIPQNQLTQSKSQTNEQIQAKQKVKKNQHEQQINN